VTRRVLLGCSAAFAGAYDFGFMTLAGPMLDADLGLGSAYPWLFSAGSFAYGAAVMPAGALAARIAPRRILAAGMLLAAAGAALVACSRSPAPALAGRALFGLGGGVAAAPALALLAGIQPAAARRAAFARLGGGVTLGFTAGVTLAALAAPALGWRGVLIAFATVCAALAVVARGPTDGDAGAHRAGYGGASWCGAAAIAVATVVWSVDAAPLLALPALLVAVGCVRVAWRKAMRWLPSARAATLAVCAAGAATTASGVGAIVLLGSALREGGTGGVVLGAFGLALLPAVAVAQRLTCRLGAAGAASGGLLIQAGGVAGLGLWLGVGSGPPALVAPLLVLGAGHVIANAGTADAITALRGGDAAPVAALLITAQYLGGGAGALLTVRVADAGGHPAAMAIAAVVAALGAIALSRVTRARRLATA
jgi:MFS family permease